MARYGRLTRSATVTQSYDDWSAATADVVIEQDDAPYHTGLLWADGTPIIAYPEPKIPFGFQPPPKVKKSRRRSK